MINEIKRLVKIQYYNSDISIQFISRFIQYVHHFYENVNQAPHFHDGGCGETLTRRWLVARRSQDAGLWVCTYK
ncbi:hypothetical protein LSAT2_025187, partial [Lamellibrachia satsuma]